MSFDNPFRPGAGHRPPYLAGRNNEKVLFQKLLEQKVVTDNIVLTGLRGVGKTVLLDTLKPLALPAGWLWVGTDMSEAATLSEDSISTRLCTDLSVITAGIPISTKTNIPIGFNSSPQTNASGLTFDMLTSIYKETPGLATDKIKRVVEIAWTVISTSSQKDKIRGIVFSYDEAQNLSDHATRQAYPLSMLLDAFQSLQKSNMPVMLVLTGLPTLFPKLVEARTFAERMFSVITLESLNEKESREAIVKPIEDRDCPAMLSDGIIEDILKMSGGYPYFIQFICKEIYDLTIQLSDEGQELVIPINEIEHKLDTDFFSGRWARATDRQRELLWVIAHLDNCNDEFTVQEITAKSEELLNKKFSSSHVNQMLITLGNHGLIFKNRHGKYSFAVPLLHRFIKRQHIDL